MESEAPLGFLYRPAFVTEREEQELLVGIRGLPFAEVRMRGVAARRRTAHFGWLYGYETWRVEPGPPVPDFLEPLRARAAHLAGVAADVLEEVLVTEYAPGAGIGWHRDAPMFGLVIGISLLGACRLRFRRGAAEAGQVRAIALEPRSAYVLTGPARSEWQHSIPPVRTARYSVTFRTVRRAGGRGRPPAARESAPDLHRLRPGLGAAPPRPLPAG